MVTGSPGVKAISTKLSTTTQNSNGTCVQHAAQDEGSHHRRAACLRQPNHLHAGPLVARVERREHVGELAARVSTVSSSNSTSVGRSSLRIDLQLAVGLGAPGAVAVAACPSRSSTLGLE
jgi:hypothetical protein